MAVPIPKWVMQRYSKLWNKHKDNKIYYSDIEKVLKADGKNTISVFLNELRNAGWIEVSLNETDMRKREYLLKNPEIIVKEMQK